MEHGLSDKFSESRLAELMSFENMSGLGNQDAFDLVGKMIDLSDIHDRPEGTHRPLELCDELAERSLDDRQRALLHYFRANAWASRRKRRHKDIKAAWAWEQPEILSELLHLRSALRHSGFEQLDNVRRCQILRAPTVTP